MRQIKRTYWKSWVSWETWQTRRTLQDHKHIRLTKIPNLRCTTKTILYGVEICLISYHTIVFILYHNADGLLLTRTPFCPGAPGSPKSPYGKYMIKLRLTQSYLRVFYLSTINFQTDLGAHWPWRPFRSLHPRKSHITLKSWKSTLTL